MVFILSKIDLNLIRAFVALYESRSVTLAAEKLYVTQPSVSYALSRLRGVFNNRLFVRTKEGMEPTVYAGQLYEILRSSLQSIECAIDSAQNFEPISTEKRFTIAMTDLGEMAMLPSIYKKLQNAAPKVELEVLPLEIDKVDEWITTGKVDVVLCSRPILGLNIERKVIFEERYVCAINEQFAPDSEELTMELFMNQKHVQVSRNQGHGLAEEVMAGMCLQRKISLVLPHFSILPSILQQTDLMVILPHKIAHAFSQMVKLKIYPLPFEVPTFEVALHWQKSQVQSPSSAWFINILTEALAVKENRENK
jgi:DNA-binding transcriptional LysR family regulator